MKTSKIYVIISFCLIAVFFVFSCTKDEGTLPVATPPPTVEACDTITYTKHIKKIMDVYCVSCHKSSSDVGGVGLSTYAEVKDRADAGRMKARVVDGVPSFMPQGGELTAAQKNLITCWLEKGKKE